MWRVRSAEAGGDSVAWPESVSGDASGGQQQAGTPPVLLKGTAQGGHRAHRQR